MPKKKNDHPTMERREALKRDFALSESDWVKPGEEIFVPWGRTDKWNLLLSVYHAGLNEAGSQKDNALMEVTISERELANKSGWEISSSSAFRPWNANSSINSPVKVRYLMVAK